MFTTLLFVYISFAEKQASAAINYLQVFLLDSIGREELDNVIHAIKSHLLSPLSIFKKGKYDIILFIKGCVKRCCSP